MTYNPKASMKNNHRSFFNGKATMDKIQPITISIGDISFSADISYKIYQTALRHFDTNHFDEFTTTSTTIEELLHQLTPAENRLPTDAQLEFIDTISQTIGIPVSEATLASRGLCSQFIDKHIDLFKTIQRIQYNAQKKNRHYVTQAYRVNKWSTAKAMAEQDTPLAAIAEHFGIKKESTIRGYFERLYEWDLETASTNENDVVWLLSHLLSEGDSIESLRAVTQELTPAIIMEARNNLELF